jgi:hydrogenase maturation protease
MLMGDEEIGVHTVREQESIQVPHQVRILHGGIGGFYLSSSFRECDSIIDIATSMDNQPEGHVQLRRPKSASEFPGTLSAHDIGHGNLMELFLVTDSIRTLQGLLTQLSPKIRDPIPAVTQSAVGIHDSEN